MTYEGRVVKTYHQGKDWSSVKMELLDTGEGINVSGRISFPARGDIYRFEGVRYNKTQFGPKIDATRSEKIETESNQGFCGWAYSFLSSGLIKGIKEKTAAKIVEKYGEMSIELLQRDIKNVKVKGFGEAKYRNALESINKVEHLIPIYKVLNGEVTVNQAKMIYQKLGGSSTKIINQNPYKLMTIDGFGFLKVDKMALANGLKEYSDARITEGIFFALSQHCEEKGNIYADEEVLVYEILKLLHGAYYPETRKQNIVAKFLRKEIDGNELVRKLKLQEGEEAENLKKWIAKSYYFIKKIYEIIPILAGEKRIVSEKGRIYTKELYDCEMGVAEIVCRLICKKSVKHIKHEVLQKEIIKYETKSGYRLEEEQKEAISLAKERIGVITGGPGRGKTTIIQLLVEVFGYHNVVLCAPTGRAAQRMKESTGYEAMTIHKLLINCQLESLSNKLIIVDETSMVDIRLAFSLLQQSMNCNIIFVGDVNQLASIGPGVFLKELVTNPHVPTIFLKKCHRNSGTVAKNSDKINEGASFKTLLFDKEMSYIPSTKDNIQDIIIQNYIDMKEKYGIKEVCILVPTKKKSSTATLILNRLIQEKTNPSQQGDSEVTTTNGMFRVNDRVMNTKNNYEKKTIQNGEEGFGIYNGDCGIVTEMSESEETLTVTFDDDRVAVFEFCELETLTLAYAMTIHKAQGSEYKGVIIAYTTENYIMLKRNSFYTAATRARLEVRLTGEEKAFAVALRTEDDSKRNSFLNVKINEILSVS